MIKESATPIEDCLDQLLRTTRADPRTTRRLLDEVSDHLLEAAAELEAGGLARVDAEREAVLRFGPTSAVTRFASRRALLTLVVETLWAAILLGASGLVAVGLSGVVVAVMNGVFGLNFVGGATVLGTDGPDVGETAHDAAALRILAGVLGVLVLAGYALWRRPGARPTVLPDGLVDALGAAAFAAATVGLTAASFDQAFVGSGGHGVGFFLSGALVSLPCAVLFCYRAARALLPQPWVIENDE
jgi:hypothetical protein